VDLFERLPTPYGLLRSGVAPDHQNIKAIRHKFARTAASVRIRFFGGVQIGRDLSVEALREQYDALLIATGCEDDRPLGIPGEALPGVHSATDFVCWYNGHPDHSAAFEALGRARRVVVIGNGNVAVDVARLLLRAPASLAATDISAPALRALGEGSVESVHLVGRRGPEEAAFTQSELDELLELDGVSVSAAPPPEASEGARSASIALACGRAGPAARRLHLEFSASPTELLADDQGRLRAVCLRRNRLLREGGRVVPVPTEERWEEPCELLLRAIGYRGVPIPGLPTTAEGIVQNEGGRVIDAAGAPIPGLYVTGWARRGPVGLIGGCRPDAQEVVEALLADLPGAATDRAPPDPEALLRAQGHPWVSWAGWERIDHEELRLGALHGKPREKLVSWGALLAVAKDAGSL
jgi:ferredoxin--NADP+ reductase